ncbi:MAG TPA: rhodanese-like domain-containing protein [Sulfuricurvum sp.]|nr:rhodanese-like domain-containing protein [Sulfuricurvum sp.]
MKKTLLSLITAVALTSSLYAYDAAKAAQFDTFYSHLTQKACANSKLFISAEETMKMVREGKPVTLLDVRTDGEASVLGLNGSNALHIPLEHLFEKASLEKLPGDRPVLILCHSGTRATMAAVSLKMAGIKNVQVVKGGMVALATADNPKNAPIIKEKK